MNGEKQPSKKTTNEKWYHLDRTFLPLKAYLFFFFASSGCVAPFVPVYVRQLGYTTSEIGIIFGTLPFISFLGKIVINGIADKFSRHKVFMTLGLIASGVIYQCVLLLPSKSTSQMPMLDARLICYKESHIKDCLHFNNTSCPTTITDFIYMTSLLTNGSTDIVCEVKCSAVSFHFSSVHINICVTTSLHGSTAQDHPSCTNKLAKNETNGLLEFSHQALTKMNYTNETYWTNETCREYEVGKLEYMGKSYNRMVCDQMTIMNCKVSCNFSKPAECIKQTAMFGSPFWILFLILLLGDICYTPIFGMSSAVLYNKLGAKTHEYGNHKLFGTIGYALLAITSTFIMDVLDSTEQGIDYTVSFYVFGGLCLITAWVGLTIDMPKDVKCSNFFMDAKQLLVNGRLNAFWFTLFCMGLMMGVISTFLFLFLQNLGSSPIIMGLSVVMSTLPSEVPMMRISGVIINKFGHLNCLYVVCVGYSVRFLCYSFLQNPWYVLPIDLLHGITFGLCWPAATSYVSVLTPQHMAASAQGLVEGVHWSIGYGIGALISGPLVDVLGSRWTFRVYAVFALVLLCYYKLVNTFCFTSEKNRLEINSKAAKIGEDVNGKQMSEAASYGIGALISGPLVDVLGSRWTFRVYAIFALVLLCYYKLVNTFCFTSEKNRLEINSKAAKLGEDVNGKQMSEAASTGYEITHS